MKAVICTRYGPPEVLQLREIEIPVPQKDEVLIRIFATTVHSGDARMRSFNIPGPLWQKFLARHILGLTRPRRAILGMELAGQIEAVGEDVKRFKMGDEVFGSTVWSGFGAYAEYKCMPEADALALKPINMTFEEAAVIPSGGITTLGILRRANIQPSQKVLIYGASGSVGTFAVQLAKHDGAHVTGVCSASNLELVKSLGADRVIDYTAENFTLNNEEYDIFFDAVDKLHSQRAKEFLKPTGIYLNVNASSDEIKKNEVISLLNEINELIEAGVLKAVIDRQYPLDQIVEAHRYVDKGHKRGNVVIRLDR